MKNIKEEVENPIKNKLISLDEFNKMNDIKKKELEERAVKLTIEKEDIPEKHLLDLKKRSIRIYFNTINKYM